jgi:hypothetical protein
MSIILHASCCTRNCKTNVNFCVTKFIVQESLFKTGRVTEMAGIVSQRFTFFFRLFYYVCPCVLFTSTRVNYSTNKSTPPFMTRDIDGSAGHLRLLRVSIESPGSNPTRRGYNFSTRSRPIRKWKPNRLISYFGNIEK